MKKFLILTIALIFAAACSTDEESTTPFHIEFVPILDVQVPPDVQRGNEYDVTVQYAKPTDCHYFNGFTYEEDGPVVTLAAQAIVIEAPDCMPLDQEEPEVATFTLTCPADYPYDYYTFKIMQGNDTLGNQYNEYTVNVRN